MLKLSPTAINSNLSKKRKICSAEKRMKKCSLENNKMNSNKMIRRPVKIKDFKFNKINRKMQKTPRNKTLRASKTLQKSKTMERTLRRKLRKPKKPSHKTRIKPGLLSLANFGCIFKNSRVVVVKKPSFNENFIFVNI